MFCSSLKKHGTNTHKFEKRKMLLLTKEELKLKLHQYAANCYICWKRILKKLTKSKNLRKVEYLYHYADKYRSVARSSSNLKFNVTSEIPFFFFFFITAQIMVIILSQKNQWTSLRGNFSVLEKIQKSTKLFLFY